MIIKATYNSSVHVLENKYKRLEIIPENNKTLVRLFFKDRPFHYKEFFMPIEKIRDFEYKYNIDPMKIFKSDYKNIDYKEV